MAVTISEPVPYAPASAVLEIISRRRHRSLPVPITAEVLGRASIPPSLVPRTLQAVKTLDLVDDDGNPTPIFEVIRTCPEADYQLRLGEWLKGAYAEVFAFVDPAKDDEIKIRDAFRSYNPAGQQERMVSLFIGLCAAAGLTPEKTASAPRATRTPAQRESITRIHQRVVNNTARKAPLKPPANSQSYGNSNELPQALAGMLSAIPNANRGWTQAQRDKFYATFGTVLDFSIPIRTEQELNENGGQE